MPNVKNIITAHNKKILNPQVDATPCTCRKYECPVNGECEKSGIIYQCTVKETISGRTECYVGLSERSLKDRLTKHRKSFRDRGYHRNSLSKHVWSLKDKNIEHQISWKILEQAKPYSPSSKVCSLCTKEVFYILFKRDMATLNKRNEFFGHCLHKRKYFLEYQ